MNIWSSKSSVNLDFNFHDLSIFLISRIFRIYQFFHFFQFFGFSNFYHFFSNFFGFFNFFFFPFSLFLDKRRRFGTVWQKTPSFISYLSEFFIAISSINIYFRSIQKWFQSKWILANIIASITFAGFASLQSKFRKIRREHAKSKRKAKWAQLEFLQLFPVTRRISLCLPNVGSLRWSFGSIRWIGCIVYTICPQFQRFW